MHGAASFIGVVILAAGASSRMGQSKLLLPWGSTSVLGQLVYQWRNLGAGHIRVVIAPDSALDLELDRLNFPRNDRLVNAHPERGMFSSIQTAAAAGDWAPHITHWGIVLGDQPHLRVTTLQRIVNYASDHPDQICQPCFNGQGGHPVIIPGALWRQISQTAARSLKEFIFASGAKNARVETDDPGIGLDLDTPADYQRALAQFPPSPGLTVNSI